MLELKEDPCSNNCFGCCFSQTAHIPEADPQNELFLVPFKCAIPVGTEDINGLYPQSVLLCVFNKDARGIEPHRLRIQESSSECRQVVTFQVGAGIGDKRKAARMRLRKGITQK